MRQPAFHDLMPAASAGALAAEAAAGLLATPAHTHPKLFYDALGSHLFDAITELDEYDLTRREAAIFATRRNADQVTMEDFTNAVERIVAGAERRGRLLRPEERERVAYHEMGHALAASTLAKTDPVHKVSTIPRSIGALGYTLQRPTDDRFLITARGLSNDAQVDDDSGLLTAGSEVWLQSILTPLVPTLSDKGGAQ